MTPVIYLQIIKKEDFYKITEDLKTLNQEKRSIESDIALSKLEIKKRKQMQQKWTIQEEDKIELAAAGLITLCQFCGRHYVLTDRGKEI